MAPFGVHFGTGSVFGSILASFWMFLDGLLSNFGFSLASFWLRFPLWRRETKRNKKKQKGNEMKQTQEKQRKTNKIQKKRTETKIDETIRNKNKRTKRKTKGNTNRRKNESNVKRMHKQSKRNAQVSQHLVTQILLFPFRANPGLTRHGPLARRICGNCKYS